MRPFSSALRQPWAEPTAATSHRPVPILIIDDNPAKRLALKAVLAPLGYLLVEAGSGAEGLRCLMADDFAVILLDVRMPIMDGFETAAYIRLRKQSEMTPIIFITAHQTDEVMTERYAEGVVDFLTTPVHPDELRAKVTVFANLFLQAKANAAEARELQASADQLRLLTESAPIGIFQTDAQNRYIYTNARWGEITGISTSEAVGQAWHIIVGDEPQRASLAADFEGDANSPEFSSRLELHDEESVSRILVLKSKCLVDAEGGIIGRVGTLADITAEATAEAAMAQARDEANAASQLKSDFLANMSHEIRSPMSVVIGLTELLLDTDLDDEQREFAQTLSKSGETLLTVINGILDFAKIERGKLEIEDVEFNMQTLVDDVVDLLTPSAKAKGLKLTAVLEDSVPRVTSGDPGRLRQVLINLASNAIKFTQEGGIVIRTTAEPAAGSENVVRFEVSDSGVGIAPDKLAAIFEPFTQADTSTTREYGGTGLGLAICHQLVVLMGGEVGLSSELGTGSTFWFTVRLHTPPQFAELFGSGYPVAVAQADTPNGSAPDVASRDADFEGVRTLVVDEDLTRRAILSDDLTAWGMTVATAVSATGALKVLHAAANGGQPISAVLVDQSLHRREDAALETAILADPELAPCLMLTNQVGQIDNAGDGAAPLPKPMRRERLRASLREALGLPSAAIGESARGAEPVSVGPEPGRILLAEDNLIHQTLALGILTEAGYEVDTARNGSEAVRAAAGQHYAAILMDCHMPQMNGCEATAAIRDQEGSSRRTPIVAMTTPPHEEDRDLCLAAGMDDHVPKPIDGELLLGKIRQAVSPEVTLGV